MSGRTKTLLENKQTTLLRQTQSTLLKMRQPQPIGGDILQVQIIPDGGHVYLSSATVLPGQALNAPILITPNNQTLTLWNFEWTLYIDPTSFIGTSSIPTNTSRWPDGSSLTIANSNLSACGYMDWAAGSDTTNTRTFRVVVRNNDSASHTYWIVARAYLPNIDQ